MSSLSVVDIYNMALSHLGIAKEVGSLTEKTEEVRSCNRFYETARDSVLRDFPWPFARKFSSLALLEEDPTAEWDYSYQYPVDCLKLRRILSGSRTDSRYSRVPYALSKISSGMAIYTDVEDAVIEYTSVMPTTGIFPSDFSLALSYRLAVYIAPRLSGGDPYKRGELALKMYDYEIQKSQASAANEEQVDLEPESEFITGRE